MLIYLINWLMVLLGAFIYSGSVYADVTAPVISIPAPEGGFQGEIGELIATAVNWAVAIGALGTLAYIIFGGWKYVTAGDDAESAEGGRAAITNGVIGLIIIASAFAIFKLLVSVLNLGSIFPGLTGASSGGGANPVPTSSGGVPGGGKLPWK